MLRSAEASAVGAPPPSIDWSAARPAENPASPAVSLPFTAPLLTAMRARAALGGGLEMLIGNPGGGRGFYIASWATLRAFAAPSLHDIFLAERVAGPLLSAGTLSPTEVQSAALAVAAEGYGGRKLAEAARCGQVAADLGTRRVRAHLLLALARQLDIPGSHCSRNDPWATEPQEHAGWLCQAPDQLAARLQDESWAATELSELFVRVAPAAWQIGIGPQASSARLPRVLRLLCGAGGSGDGNPAGEAATVERCREAETALGHARALLDDPAALLTGWRADRAALLRQLERPDWLLDGWDRVGLTRRGTPERSALLQILLHAGESGRPLRRSELEAAGTRAANGAATSFDQLARNEDLRLREVQLHDPDLAAFDASPP